MAKPNQLSFVVPTEVRVRLEQLSAESGRSVAALIREAVVQYLGPIPGAGLTPDALWALLRTPENWAAFKQLAADMEAQPFVGTGAPAPAPPSWKYQRPAGVEGRAAKPPEDDEPPF
jgi:predicted DNA-binding protein